MIIDTLPLEIYYGLLLLPLIGLVPKKYKLLNYTIIAAIQLCVFFTMKSKNCNEISCPQIENHRERILFYQKFQTFEEDLNKLRSEEFQQTKIFDCLNHQLGVFLLILSLSQSRKYIQTLNTSLYIILVMFSIEATMMLSNEIIYRLPLSMTYFELGHLIRIMELNILLWIREISMFFENTNTSIIRNQLKIQKEGISLEMRESLMEISNYLEKEPDNQIFSSRNTYILVSILSMSQLLKKG